MAKQIEPPNPTAAALVDIAAAGIADVAAPIPLPRQATIPMPEVKELDPGPHGKYAKPNGLEDPREALARGLLKYDVLRAERDQLDRDLKTALERNHLLQIHINELEGTRATIENRINTCVLQRDDAVREAGELRGALNAVAAVCAKYHSVEQD